MTSQTDCENKFKDYDHNGLVDEIFVLEGLLRKKDQNIDSLTRQIFRQADISFIEQQRLETMISDLQAQIKILEQKHHNPYIRSPPH